MSADYIAIGQMSLFDLDTWSGRMSTEPSAVTVEKTSAPCLKKPLKLPKGMPLFLDLRTDRSGRPVDTSWEIGGALLGADTMPNIGECHRDANECVWLPTSTDTPHRSSYLILSTGEKPSSPRPSKLSQILETNPNPKYNLSAKACQGILNRADRRGKELPVQLRTALEAQCLFRNELESQGVAKESLSNGTEQEHCLLRTSKASSDDGRCLNPWDVQSKHVQPTDGIAEALYSGECRGGGGESYVMTIDEKMGTTYIHEEQGNTLAARDYKQPQAVVSFTTEMTPKTDENGVGFSLRSRDYKDPQAVVYGMSPYHSNAMLSDNPHSGIYEADTSRTLDLNGGSPACNQGGMIVLEGNGQRDSHRGDGYAESEVSYTPNTVEQHAVCIGNGQLQQLKESELVGTLNCMHDQQAIITYGLDRASFNQGQNAKFDFSVEEELAPTVVSRGPGGGY